MIEQRAGDVGALRDRAGRCLDHRLRGAAGELTHTVARLRALSPAATLQRGYAIVQREDGQVLRVAADTATGEALRVRLAEGGLTVKVTGHE
jgi:exodeoxyribonuclease VII large subunit